MIFLLFLINAVATNEFFTYGINNNFSLPKGDSVFYGPIELSHSLIYLDCVYTGIFIHSDGYITFSNSNNSQELQFNNSVGIAAYFAHNNASLGGFISYREITHNYKLKFFSKKISNFSASFGFIVTWFQMRSVNISNHGHNTFQLIVLSDGIYTYAVVNLYDIVWKSQYEDTTIFKNLWNTTYNYKNQNGIRIFKVDHDLKRTKLTSKKMKQNINCAEENFIDYYILLIAFFLNFTRLIDV